MKNINAEFNNLSRALEFDIILSDIASYANIEKNKNKILSFRPLNKLEDIYSWLLDELDYTSITLERNTILHPKN